jgi:hypothetical protein
MAAIPFSPFVIPSSSFLGTRTSPRTPQLRTPTRPRQYKHQDFSSPTPPDNPRKAFLRERLRQRCFDRAQQAREKKIKASRWSASNAPSSDGFEYEMDDEDECDNEDYTLNDEVRCVLLGLCLHALTRCVFPSCSGVSWLVQGTRLNIIFDSPINSASAHPSIQIWKMWSVGNTSFKVHPIRFPTRSLILFF